ncbi:MAG TPA: hypothetical protein VGM78_11760, partial [Ilumatobacteraceae bacterium]
IHSIDTTKRETYYWIAILFTFALGTSAGDWIAEGLNLGYWKSLLLFAAAIALVAALRFALHANAVLTFWIAYVLTRPLGASTGDYLSSPNDEGGLNMGTAVTTVAFLATILAIVIYLTVQERRRRTTSSSAQECG